jgi:hypothetical protein
MSNLSIVEKQLNALPRYNRYANVSAAKEAKNMAIEASKDRPADGTTNQQIRADVRGRLVQYAFYMQKQGYSPETIRLNMTALRVLDAKGAQLLDSESVKETIAKQKQWSECRKRNVINAYTLFLKLNGQQWEKPKTNVTQKFPFIPTE